MSQAKPFLRIGIICDYLHPETSSFISLLLNFLQKHGRVAVITQGTHQLIPDLKATVILENKLTHQCDLLIAIGGDGSLLRASMLALDHQLPILGINRGHLGFLTALPATQLEQLLPILEGNYIQEERLVLEAHVLEGNHIIHSMRALNDIVLTHTQATHMLDFEVLTQNRRICQLRADGYIVATPTGSTAYALSAGGPIVEPQTNAFALVPMFSHSLSSRPLVISATHIIDIRLDHNQTKAIISADGQVQYHFNESMHCRIKQSDKKLKLIHTLHYDYFTNLSEKLSWNNSTKRN
jgi:NAD+ kinase